MLAAVLRRAFSSSAEDAELVVVVVLQRTFVRVGESVGEVDTQLPDPLLRGGGHFELAPPHRRAAVGGQGGVQPLVDEGEMPERSRQQVRADLSRCEDRSEPLQAEASDASRRRGRTSSKTSTGRSAVKSTRTTLSLTIISSSSLSSPQRTPEGIVCQRYALARPVKGGGGTGSAGINACAIARGPLTLLLLVGFVVFLGALGLASTLDWASVAVVGRVTRAVLLRVADAGRALTRTTLPGSS
jgi:hypothetical protein